MRATKMADASIRMARRIWAHLSREALSRLKEIIEQHRFSVPSGDLIYLQNGWYVTHTGLLGLARRNRCAGIHVRPVSGFCDPPSQRWAFEATVYKSKTCRGFVGYGDANPSNVSYLVQGAEMRVAETRAVNRALRKAYGIGICSIEEIGSVAEPSPIAQEPKKLPTKSSNGNGQSLDGNVIEITPAGAVTTLYNFCSQPKCTDGREPMAGLVQATNGNFYGTASNGGANGYGTVFQITSAGELTTIYSFCSQTGCTDGDYPEAQLLQAANGNLYGTTSSGGANGYGTVFEIAATGKLTTLHSFDYTDDGAYPYGGLIQATNGDLFGTTSEGGANGNYGTVFEITPAGKLTTLYSFCSQTGCSDGESPYGTLLQATNGGIYGTTSGGGANGNYGTIFKIAAGGQLTTLHSFDSTDGERPYAGLIQGTDGNFYGTTGYGGASAACFSGCGTIFDITLEGALTTLYNFCSQPDCVDGFEPQSGLTQATRGNFYGMTFTGGTDNVGTVFSLSVGLNPFVEARPTSGKIGQIVRILGNTLTGTTSVTFNGEAAAFKVESDTYLQATVPSGATTGVIQVATTNGALKSNVPFQVLP